MAIKHFADFGLDGARIDAIAAEAGVNKALLYYHFQDKASLYEHAMIDVIQRTADAVSADLAACSSSAEHKLRTFIASLAQSVNSNPSFAPLVLREIASGGADLTPEVLQQIGRLMELLRDILKEGETSGVFKPVSPIVMQMQIMGGMLYFSAGSRIRTDMLHFGFHKTETLAEQSAEAIADTVADIVLNGLRT